MATTTHPSQPFATDAAPRREAFFNGRGVYAGWQASIGSLFCLIAAPSIVAQLCFGVFVPYLRHSFGWSVADISWGSAITEVMVTIVSLLAGVLLDRYGARRMILFCIPAFGLAFAAMSLLGGSLWQFYLGYALLPLIGVGVLPGAWVKVTAGWFDRRLGLAIAVATLGIGFGAVIMPLIVNHIAETRGWRAAYAIVGLGSIALAWPVAAAFVRDAPARAGPGRVAPFSYADTARRPVLWLLVGAFVFLGIFSSVALVNLVSVLEGNGMAARAAVGAMSTLGLATMIGRLLCGWLLDRFPLYWVMPVFAAAAGASILTVAGGATGVAAYICAGWMGLLVGAEIDVLGYAVKRFFGSVGFGKIYGLVFAAFHLGGATGAMAMSIGSRLSGGGSGPGLRIGGVACALAALLFLALRRADAATSSTLVAVPN